MRFGDVLIAQNRQPSEKARSLRHFLLEGCRLKTAYDTEILFLIMVPQVSRSLLILPRIEDLEFHLSEVINLQKTTLEGADHTRSSQCDEEFFDRIEINDATGKTRNRLHKPLVGETANQDASLLSGRSHPIRNIARTATCNLTNLLVGEQRSLGRTAGKASYTSGIHITLRCLYLSTLPEISQQNQAPQPQCIVAVTR